MIFFMSFIYGTPPLTPSTLNIRIRVRIKIPRIRNIISLVDGIRVVNLILPVILILLETGMLVVMEMVNIFYLPILIIIILHIVLMVLIGLRSLILFLIFIVVVL